MRPGIEDVARAAGVSTATVSRALRGLPNVTEATRRRVREAADTLGYVPSPSAASLVTGRTRTIAVVCPWVNHWFFANVIEGAEMTLRTEGFDVLLHTFDSSRAQPRPPLDPSALRRRVDGVIVLGVPLEEDEIRAVLSLGQPVIFIGTGSEDASTVRLDDVRTGREATEHLLSLGHRRIGHLVGTPDGIARWNPGVQRQEGWLTALRAAGIEPEPGWAVPGRFDIATGRAALHELLDRHPDVTAVFAASDEMAMGAVIAARERGIEIGRDVSLIGVDGHDVGEVLGLTTMAQPALEQGQVAATMLLDMMTGAPVPEDVVFTSTLVRRTSTAPPSP
ncbi:MAG: LacI family transcriptional regulator [Actinomycetales bacterium]|nr:LacI family transcriptional regulator [Actinomycetales bacterium]